MKRIRENMLDIDGRQRKCDVYIIGSLNKQSDKDKNIQIYNHKNCPE